MVLESINHTLAIILLIFAMFENHFQKWPFLWLLKIFPFLEDVDWKLVSCDWSALFLTPASPLTITLKQFIPDHKCRNPNRKKNELFYPYD